MTPHTVKLLKMFFLAVALLNLTNYASYLFYKPPTQKAVMLDLQVHAPRTRRFLAKSRATRATNWTASLVCSHRKIANDPLTEQTTSETALNINLADFVEPTTETNSFDYFNGVRMGPVMCPMVPSGLGPIPVNETEVELELVEKLYPEVQSGGMYTPPNCTARHKVAIIIPFRNRLQHLPIFLRHMHPFLITQQLEYGIFIVQQDGNSDFNRGKLMNVGFVESQKLKEGGWQCFIFHDIDLLPLDLRNTYSCPRQPRHMSASIDKFKFKLQYEKVFGGVSAMTLEQFTKVNGFPNRYWGWGSEDDDLAERVQEVGYHMARYKMPIARYLMLDHKKSSPNPKRFQLRSQTSKLFQKDGLSSLEYQIMRVSRHHLYTHILANIDEPSCLGTNGNIDNVIIQNGCYQSLSRSNAKQAVLKNFHLLLFTTIWL